MHQVMLQGPYLLLRQYNINYESIKQTYNKEALIGFIGG
jgi:hypothetical protein